MRSDTFFPPYDVLDQDQEDDGFLESLESGYSDDLDFDAASLVPPAA